MEQVFESGPHVRLLLMLHGDADEYKLNDLSQASGISAIQVRQAMFELRNAGVVTYNDETQVVALTQRFLN
jgi:DNA-binding IscR family transcriptional regulator